MQLPVGRRMILMEAVQLANGTSLQTTGNECSSPSGATWGWGLVAFVFSPRAGCPFALNAAGCKLAVFYMRSLMLNPLHWP